MLEASGSLTASNTVANHSEVQVKPNSSNDTSSIWRPHCRRLPTSIGARTAAQAVSDDEEAPGRGLDKSTHRKLQQRSNGRIRKYLGMALEKQATERRCWWCCRRRRRRSPDTASIWSTFSTLGRRRKTRYCERTTRWAPHGLEFLNHQFSSGTAGLGLRKATCSLPLLLAGVRLLRREEDPSLMAVCEKMPTCDSREKPQTAPPHDVARDGG